MTYMGERWGCLHSVASLRHDKYLATPHWFHSSLLFLIITFWHLNKTLAQVYQSDTECQQDPTCAPGYQGISKTSFVLGHIQRSSPWKGESLESDDLDHHNSAHPTLNRSNIYCFSVSWLAEQIHLIGPAHWSAEYWLAPPMICLLQLQASCLTDLTNTFIFANLGY